MKIAAVHLQTMVNEVAAKIVVEKGVDWGNPAEQDSHSHRFGVLHGSNRFPCLKHNHQCQKDCLYTEVLEEDIYDTNA
jgi:hypothetical protein